MSGVELQSNLSHTPIWGNGCKGSKNCPFSSQIIQNQKFYSIKLRSQLEGEVSRYSSFWSWKSTVPTPISPLNWARKLRYLHSLKGLDVPFEDFEFSTPSHLLTGPSIFFHYGRSYGGRFCQNLSFRPKTPCLFCYIFCYKNYPIFF